MSGDSSMTVQAHELPLARMQHWERRRGDRTFLTQPMGGGVLREYTWAEAIDESRRMAAWLLAQGWPPGSRIAILSKNCAHWLMSDFAIWMAGHVSVPLYPTLTAASVRQILEHSEAVACFVGKLDDWPQMQDGMPEQVQGIAYPLSPQTPYPQWDDIVARQAPLRDIPERRGDELATIIYTSGTTGMPKGVMHDFNAMAWAIRAGNKRFGMTENERVLSYLPLSHIAERVAVEAGVLLAGFHVYFAESLDTFIEDLQRARPTFFFSVPRLWVKFQQGVQAKLPQAKLDRLLRIPLLGRLVRRRILTGLGLDQCRFAGGGAAPMPPSVLAWYRKLGLEIIEVYGMTENFAISHSNLPGATRPGYVGYPYEGVEARLAEDGEVQVRSPAIMLGYYKDQDKTREAITDDGFLRTGDRGELDAEGRLRITGRVKDIFKTAKGKYVAPAPIEDRLITHSAVEACCVMGAERAQPFALLMLAPDALAAASDATARQRLLDGLASHLDAVNGALDRHEQLDFLVVVGEQWTVENNFVTPTMKVKRNVVEEHYAGHCDAWTRRAEGEQGQRVIWAA